MKKIKSRQKKGSEKQQNSVLQADQLFVKKILSRNSSVGNQSSHQESFRASAEVPFKWESRPGEPKYKPKTQAKAQTQETPIAGNASPPSTTASESHAPSGASRPALGHLLSRARAKHILKKLVKKGQRGFNIHKHIFQPARLCAVARGSHSAEIGRANDVTPGSSRSSFNNLGFSTAPVSPCSSSSSSSSLNRFKLTSLSRFKFQIIDKDAIYATWGCIKSRF